MLPTIAREDDAVVMVDQRKLPAQEIYVRCRTAAEVAKAIKTMVIRGAPAIGVAAAFGIALGMRKSTATGTQKFAAEFYKTCELMAGTRPTAVNLFWAIERMKRVFAAAMGIALGMRKSKATGTQKFAAEFHKICELMAATRPTAVNLFWAIERLKQVFAASAEAGESVDQIKERLDRVADAIHDDDLASCRAMGAFGAAVVPAEATILTHCNAGALATAGYGTALGVIRGAVEAGKRVTVLADETRPFLQGARLTAWELGNAGVPFRLAVDSAGPFLMARGQVDAVILGADRICANGDVINKVGSYAHALGARAAGIPFICVAPESTVDLATPSGDAVEIEDRGAAEVVAFGGVPVAPAGAAAVNPAFDVTPHPLVTAIVTDRRVVRLDRGDQVR